MIAQMKPENQKDDFDSLVGFSGLMGDISSPVSITTQSYESSDKKEERESEMKDEDGEKR